jgi:DNA replication ATP-dependent helicase Dna2
MPIASSLANGNNSSLLKSKTLSSTKMRPGRGLPQIENDREGGWNVGIEIGHELNESHGYRCFADMVIKTYVDQSETTLSKIARHIYTFVRSEQSVIERKGSFLNGHIGKNDPVSLSIEPDLLTMAVGFVVSLTPTEVTIGTNQKLDLGALLERSGKLRDYGQDYEPVFRIDKDEMLSGTTRMRSNLAQMFYSEESGGDTRRRDLIVRLEEPRFESVWAPDTEEIPDHLNEDQRNAMTKVLTAKDYACILGMPGTGKTTTIAEIILALVKRGKSVLLTSYTHSAVDTILTKLVNSDHKILRLGNIEKVSKLSRGPFD